MGREILCFHSSLLSLKLYLINIMFSRKCIQWNVWKQKFGLQTIETTLMNIYPYLRSDGSKGHLHSIFPHNSFAIVPRLLICLLAVLKYASHWDLNTYLTMLVWINGIKIWRFLKAIIQSHLEKWQIKIKVSQGTLGRWLEGRKIYLFSFLSILWLFELAKWKWLNPIWPNCMCLTMDTRMKLSLAYLYYKTLSALSAPQCSSQHFPVLCSLVSLNNLVIGMDPVC